LIVNRKNVVGLKKQPLCVEKVDELIEQGDQELFARLCFQLDLSGLLEANGLRFREDEGERMSRLLKKLLSTFSKHPDPKVSRMINQFESACHALS
jgi:hypothetical protein